MTTIRDLTIANRYTEKALQMYERFRVVGDNERAEKMEKLLKKLHENTLIIAFSGHFSAGKSTMINTLIGSNILPSSPIPTSANLVRIQRAENEYATVYYDNDAPLRFEAPYDFQKVKEYCKDGDVNEIEIGHVQTALPAGITLMDTPGVDSTDDAHRIATESAIHLADIVFYVMDYNHVQSELNFTYTKELLEHGAQLYLIINQIDKHREEELSFQTFKQSVQTSFSSWNVAPVDIFYTTLKEPDHPDNQYEEVKGLVNSVLHQQEKWMKITVQAAFKRLESEHGKWLQDQEEEEAAPYEELLGKRNEEEKSQLLWKEQQLIADKQELEEKGAIWKKSFEEKRLQVIESAYLMPYQTRELAEQYLTSVQPDFKVGFLFGKKKTEQERETRLTAFLDDLQKQVESQLEWHLRQFVSERLLEAGIYQEELQVEAQQLRVEVKKDLLESAVKQGARISGEYVLHYCEEVRRQLLQLAIRKSDELKEKALALLESQIAIKIQQLDTELIRIQPAANAIRSLQEIACLWQEKRKYSPTQTETAEAYEAMQAGWRKEKQNIRIFTEEQHDTQQHKEKQPAIVREIDDMSEQTNRVPLSKMVNVLEEAVSLFNHINGFQRLTAHLIQKLDRLKNQAFTISLFGAFSAGKSSFANALLGEKVLPVSPNPTTAAINRICPPNQTYIHGTAAVHLKSEAQMLEDLRRSLQLFQMDCYTLSEAYEKVPTILNQHNVEGKEKVHLAFLQAFHSGYLQFGKKLGTTIVTNLEQFQGFVAHESQSCFVEAIDLYYDSPLTKKGITLVDTPGADSINARHTDVAFEYIKNADAILFVTYYNHAFSKADREFLMQLGRVKDAFELDKMFFIINAIDLAESQDDLTAVLTYVNEQLSSYGIRFPRLFGVSSLLALNEKTRAESQLASFEQSFYPFLEKDLTDMAIQSAEAEIHRGLSMLETYIAAANESQEQKELKRALLQQKQSAVINRLEQMSISLLAAKMQQELQELIFYIKQRAFYRFPDFFREAFNPSVLQTSHKQALRSALTELLTSFGFEFSQELRATSLRIEKFIQTMMQQQFIQYEKELQAIQDHLTFTAFEMESIETPSFPPAFTNISLQPLEQSFKYFKNAKSFFEKNEKQYMQADLEQLLSPLADAYLEEQSTMITAHYETMIEHAFLQLIVGMKADCTEQFAGWLDALVKTEDVDEWVKVYDLITEKMNN